MTDPTVVDPLTLLAILLLGLASIAAAFWGGPSSERKETEGRNR
jgi:hypothetical protein